MDHRRVAIGMRRSPLVGLGITLLTGALAGQTPAAETVSGLGTLTFPTSTRAAAAQTAFVRGVLLLHLFEYPDAVAAFRDAERLDPGFAMAYWGEAMTYTHPVWDEQDSAAGRAALTKLAPSAAARETGADSGRERGFMRAVDILYGPGPKARRDTLYSEAMGHVLRAHPTDDEARLFYALSLLGLSQGVRQVPTYLRAAAMAESIFVRNPQHPGAVHYWIHGMDDPEHGTDALPAARALSHIAPDADHAQHMTSHIFMALGMWDDVVRANQNAMRMVDTKREAHGRAATHCGHYNSWLDYGYLEQGRLGDARRLLAHCRDQAGAHAGSGPDNAVAASYASMWTRYLLDTRDWRGAVAEWTVDTLGDEATHLEYDFTRAFVAAERGDIAVARSAERAYGGVARAIAKSDSGSTDPETLELGQRNRVLGLELRGLIAVKSSAPDSGLALLARAAATEDSMVYEFGPPFVDEPAHELLGESLLGAHRFGDAEREFRAALKRTPRRTAALLGLARAQAGAGDAKAAAVTRSELSAIWHGADPGVK